MYYVTSFSRKQSAFHLINMSIILIVPLTFVSEIPISVLLINMTKRARQGQAKAMQGNTVLLKQSLFREKLTSSGGI